MFIDRLSATYLSKNLILVQKVSFMEIENFDLLDFSKKWYYILSANIHHKFYANVINTQYYDFLHKYGSIRYYNVIHSINFFLR